MAVANLANVFTFYVSKFRLLSYSQVLIVMIHPSLRQFVQVLMTR